MKATENDQGRNVSSRRSRLRDLLGTWAARRTSVEVVLLNDDTKFGGANHSVADVSYIWRRRRESGEEERKAKQTLDEPETLALVAPTTAKKTKGTASDLDREIPTGMKYLTFNPQSVGVVDDLKKLNNAVSLVETSIQNWLRTVLPSMRTFETDLSF